MKRINMNIALCKEYDFNAKSVDGFLQEVVTTGNKAEVTILTMISGIGDERENFKYDFYVKYIEDENEVKKEAVSYIFTMRGTKGEKDELKSSFNNTYNEITALKKEISFLGSGYYEIVAYESDETVDEEKSAKERYKHYISKMSPTATYQFKVI